MAVDPTYPLLPIASILSSTLLLLVLATSFIRQSWNLGVAALCFWLCLENLVNGTNAILWADNTDIKAVVYCDIVTHLQIFTFIVKPACSLVITRRLYKIASMRSINMEQVSQRARCIDRFVDASLVLILPTIVTGVFYYIVQGERFQILEGFGCSTAITLDGVSIMLTQLWLVILPLVSVLFYIPRIVLTFYRVKRETNQFLNSNNSLSRNFYYRILSLGCLDILFTLPFGIVSLFVYIHTTLRNEGYLPFYSGWTLVHSKWSPASITYSELKSGSVWPVVETYLPVCESIMLAFITFALFGLTSEARAMYRTWFYGITGLSRQKGNSPLVSNLAFGAHRLNPAVDVEQGLQRNLAVDSELSLGRSVSHSGRFENNGGSWQTISQVEEEIATCDSNDTAGLQAFGKVEAADFKVEH